MFCSVIFSATLLFRTEPTEQQCRNRAKMSEYGEDKDKRAASDPLTPLNYVDQNPQSRRRATAVAIKGPSAEKGAAQGGPQIVASGRGVLAEEILALAFENGVRVREDKDLAELLAFLDIDTPIPSEALEAVAEILSYVYQANGQVNPFDAVLKDVMSEQDQPQPINHASPDKGGHDTETKGEKTDKSR